MQKNSLLLLLLLALLIVSVNCQPAKNVSSDLHKDSLSMSDKAKLLGTLIPPILSFIGASIAAYFLYKNSNAVAKNLMEVSAEAYNVSVGSLKNAYCWSFNVFCSSLMCCCSQRGWFWCCRGRQNKRPRCECCCKKENETSQNENENRRAEKTPMISFEPLVKTDNNTDITNFNPFYSRILKGSQKIDFHKFLNLHQVYSKTFSRMSHTTYCENNKCIEKKHVDFEKWSGICLEPFLYFFVLDWSYLRRYSSNEKVKTVEELFKLVFRNHQPYDNQLDKEWDDLTRKLRKNILITLVNFPGEENSITQDSDDGKLLLLIVKLYKVLEIRVANVVESSWKVREKRTLEGGKKEVDLDILTELKTFPKQRDLKLKTDFLNRVKIINDDENDVKEQVINQDQTEDFFDIDFPDDAESPSTIHLKNIPSKIKNLVCRIYLGDKKVKNDEGDTWYNVPCLESPVISFGSILSTNTTSSSPLSISSSVSSSSHSLDPPVFEFTTEDGGDLPLFSSTVNLMRKAELERFAGILDKDPSKGPKWRKVADEVFKDMPQVKEKELNDIQNNGLHGGGTCGLALLDALKGNETGYNMIWSNFIETCRRNKIYGVEDAFSEEENIQFKNKRLDKLDTKYRENIGRKLDILGRWQRLTGEFEMEQHTVTRIENARHQPGQYSPTEWFVNLIWEKKPNYTIRELARACWDSGFINAVDLLKGFGRKQMASTQLTA